MGRPKGSYSNPLHTELFNRIAKVEEAFKVLDSQNRTIIQMLADLRREQAITNTAIETTIGERIEKLRRAILDAMTKLAGDTSPAVDTIKHWVLSKNQKGATQ